MVPGEKMERFFYLFLTMISGVAMSLQLSVNAALGKRIGSLEAGLVSFSSGTLFLLIVVLLFGSGQFWAFLEAPKWQWTGGILGIFIVVSMIVVTPKLGVLVALMVALVGQMVMSVIIDHYGLFAVDVVPVSWERIVGLLLLLAGMALIVKSKV